jgi:hypothetical protein
VQPIRPIPAVAPKHAPELKVYLYHMGIFYSIMYGYFFGFALGVGCALAVMYTIYTNGYRKGVEHSLLAEKPKRYQEALASIQRRVRRVGRAGN